MTRLASNGTESLHLDLQLHTYSPPRERMTTEKSEGESHGGGGQGGEWVRLRGAKPQLVWRQDDGHVPRRRRPSWA